MSKKTLAMAMLIAAVAALSFISVQAIDSDASEGDVADDILFSALLPEGPSTPEN